MFRKGYGNVSDHPKYSTNEEIMAEYRIDKIIDRMNSSLKNGRNNPFNDSSFKNENRPFKDSPFKDKPFKDSPF